MKRPISNKTSKSHQRSGTSRKMTKPKAARPSRHADAGRPAKNAGANLRAPNAASRGPKHIEKPPKITKERAAAEAQEVRVQRPASRPAIKRGEMHQARKRKSSLQPEIVPKNLSRQHSEAEQDRTLTKIRPNAATTPTEVETSSSKGETPKRGKQVRRSIPAAAIILAKEIEPNKAAATVDTPEAASVSSQSAETPVFQPAIAAQTESPAPYKPKQSSNFPQLQVVPPDVLEKVEDLVRKSLGMPSAKPIDPYMTNLYIAAAGSPENLIRYLEPRVEVLLRRGFLVSENEFPEAVVTLMKDHYEDRRHRGA